MANCLNCKMQKTIFITLMVMLLLLSGCQSDLTELNFDTITGYFAKENINMNSLADKISELPKIDNETIVTKENSQEIMTKVNVAIKLLNKEGGFNFEVIEPTQKNCNKVNKVITKYSPILNNYNEVIECSKNYDESSQESVEDFYIASGKFGLELTLITATIYHGATYQAVGMVYRGLGINRLAFTCPTCVSHILSKTYWFATTYMVDKSSESAEWILDKTKILIDSMGGVEGIKNKIENQGKDFVNFLNQEIEKIKDKADS